jgi:osmotically-inducible protein OsmY
MNPTSLITLPARLGYEVARRTLDVVAGAGRMVGGLLGGSQDENGGDEGASSTPRRAARPKAGMDDVTLARKVETEIFRIRGVAKGKIDVNAADGVVWLRGEARTPEFIKRVEAKAAGVPEVARVENLLHLPKTPAPSRTDTPAAQRRTRRTSDRTTQRTTKARAARGGAAARREGAPPERTTAEKRTAPAEPAPARLAAQGEGRQPAPLGTPVEGPDDITLTRTVETAIFRDADAPKGAVDVNAADGVVWLRGTARSPDEVRELQRRALAVPGVKRVENLLHLPGTPAPTRADTPPEEQRTGSRAEDPEERPVARRFTEERPGEGEPLPSELADRGDGRQPAPLGAGDDAPGGGGDVRGSLP